MAVNNVQKIRELLKFPDKNSFYFLEVLKRKKENPNLEKHAKLIRDFYIYSFEEFDVVAEKAIQLCEENNARAYFRLNMRDAKKIAFQYNKRLSELLITEDYKNIPRSYAAVVGEFHSDPDKTWIVDIDNPEGGTFIDYQSVDEVAKDIKEIYAKYAKEDALPVIVATLPTKNGTHLITRPFRLDMFNKQWTDIDVHKDNPTILYVP
jgi:hypothetical protein